MAQTGYTPISLYYSTTAAAAPTAGNLVAGELALNTQDEKLYFKNAAGTVKLLASSAGASGDVVGPASATDNAIPTYDGTTGKLIKNNSGVTISSGTITATGFSGPLNGTVGATTPNTGAFTSVTSTSASGVLTRAAATQDGVELVGGAGGTTSLKVTFTPTTLTASRTLTLPDASGTILQSGTAVTVAQGGTGITSGTSGGVPYFSSTSAIASSAALAANALVIGGGAGAAPSTTTTGTGVLTALGVNTGSAGAFVVNGGALGTPSSGTVTNLTGTASININGTVGATTPNTGAFTTLSATGLMTNSNTSTGAHLLFSNSQFKVGAGDSVGIIGASATSGALSVFSGNSLYFGVGTTKIMEMSSTGLAVTGTLSATGAISGTGADNNIVLSQNGSTQWRINNSNAGTAAAANLLLQNGTAVAGVYLFGTGYTTNGVLKANSASLYNNNSAGVSIAADNASGVITFASGGLTERMRINSSGNVGIGTTAPTLPLTVDGEISTLFDNNGTALEATAVFIGNGNSASTATHARVAIIGSTTGTVGELYFTNRGVGSYNSFGCGIRGGYAGADARNNTLTFFTSHTTDENVERVRIESTGNVGIGTTSPSTYGKFAVQTQTSNAPTVAITGSGLNPQLNHYINDSTAVLRNLNQIQFVTGSSDISNYQGYMTFSTMGSAGGTISERMRIDSSGNVLVGATSTLGNGGGIYVANSGANVQSLTTNSTSNSTYYIGRFYAGGTEKGYIYFDGTNVSYTNLSDYRLKENVAPMQNALEKVAELKPVTYTLKSNGKASQGFIAHELQAVVPDAVVGEKDAVDEEGNPVYQGVDTSFLVATLTAAIKEQQAIIEALKARLDAAGL